VRLTCWRSAANVPDRYQIPMTIVGAFVSCNGVLGSIAPLSENSGDLRVAAGHIGAHFVRAAMRIMGQIVDGVLNGPGDHRIPHVYNWPRNCDLLHLLELVSTPG